MYRRSRSTRSRTHESASNEICAETLSRARCVTICVLGQDGDVVTIGSDKDLAETVAAVQRSGGSLLRLELHRRQGA